MIHLYLHHHYLQNKLRDNDDEYDLQKVLISEADSRQMIRMRINKLKNERTQNLNQPSKEVFNNKDASQITTAKNWKMMEEEK